MLQDMKKEIERQKGIWVHQFMITTFGSSYNSLDFMTEFSARGCELVDNGNMSYSIKLNGEVADTWKPTLNFSTGG